jgi:hypothetical protein
MDDQTPTKRREIVLDFSDEIPLRDTVNWGQRIIETRREIADGKDHELATGWAKLTNPADWQAHPAYKRFTDLISLAPRFTGHALPLYRGQAIDRSLGVPTVARIGLRPYDGKIIQNRYSLGRALYLADTELGVLREVRPPADKDLYLIRFALPTSLAIADFADTIAGEFLNEVIARAEACGVEHRGLEGSLDFSQYFADLVVNAGFDGIRTRGVRGDAAVHYTNVTILKKLDDWDKWLEPNCTPFLFAPPPPIV